jgi:hypothetical protein
MWLNNTVEHPEELRPGLLTIKASATAGA